MSRNLRGSLLMVAAMASFSLEDMLVKQIAAALPVGQIIALLGFGGMLVFGSLVLLRGHRLWSPALLSRPVMLRNLGEMVATAGFVSAIVLTTLSSASAILQALPLLVTLGAAVFLGERVSWQRAAAIAVGLLGVMLVLQPGLAGFEPASLLAVIAIGGLALRDLAVRIVPPDVTSAQLAAWAFAAVVVTGALMMLILGTPPALPSAADGVRLVVALIADVIGYYALVAATRTGEVAVVVPYRYTRLLFAMLLGVLVLGEQPGLLTLTGAVLIVGAGLYTFLREARVRRRFVTRVGSARRDLPD